MKNIMEKIMPEIIKQCREQMPDIIAIRRDIHMHPETGFDVQRTAELAAVELEKLGIKVKRGIGKTGVVGDLKVPGADKCIALRADMDALPMQEVNNEPYKSIVDGKAHMCGHDAHTAILIGAARVIAGLKDKLKTNVRFIFQPSEELLPGGALSMIEDGVLEGVDEIYGLHVWSELETGVYAVCDGPAMGQPDNFTIEITGKGGHAAMPHTTKDPIVAGAHVVTMLQTIISRTIDPMDQAVVSVTKFHSGTADNIIPEEVCIEGTVRTFTGEMRSLVKGRMETILSGVAASFDCSSSFKYTEGYPVTFNHKQCIEKALSIAGLIVSEGKISFPYKPQLGGEDFGYFSEIIPACFVCLGCSNTGKGIIHDVHNPKFNIDEDCLEYGMALIAGLVF